MARNVVTNATVTLSINDRNAAENLENLKKRTKLLNEEINRLAAAGTPGNNPRLKQLRKELSEVSRDIRRCESELSQTESVLRRLDSATPKQLRKALATLRSELNNIERGSSAWDAHVSKIRLVEGEIRKVNAEVGIQKSRWERLNDTVGKWQTAIMGAAAAVTGLVMAGRHAVDEMQKMDQEMANVRKFTGMSAGEVAQLNEEFRKIDTRTGRDDLNRLAQEAGRLGKTSREDVLGFVRAADKINVSLDDLGEGATLTLSKLTGIFGDEKRLGTERALLSVGSVINELSQNCSASAPYLAQFASRMGGVASQAGLTIQQVMAFGAVLDTTNQGVEAASTAVSQVITRLFQDTAKYARVAGLDVKEFSEHLRRDANGAFIEFLEALNKAGGMDVLSPMFKDMGENGARAIAALSSLATHIDDVKRQQIEANKAFAEATSIDREFEVQNTTLLAGREKAAKEMKEKMIELGEKIQPIMKYIYSSGRIAMEALSLMVDFLVKARIPLLTLTAAVISYNTAVALAAVRTRALGAAKGVATAAAVAWRVAVLAASAAVSLMTGNVTKARAAWQLLGSTLKLSPLGLIVGLLTAVGTALAAVSIKTREFRNRLDESVATATSFAEATARERGEIDRLFGTLEGATKGTKAYNEARDAIISKYGVYLKGLVDERGEINNLTLAYERLGYAAERSAQVRALARGKEKLDDAYFSKIDELTEKLRKSLKSADMREDQVTRLVTSVSESVGSGRGIRASDFSEIRKYSEKHSTVIQSLTGSTPFDILGQIRSATGEYSSRRGKLEGMESRALKGVATEELDALIEGLSERLGQSPVKSVEVKFEADSGDVAEKLNYLIPKYAPGDGGSYLKGERIAAPLQGAGRYTVSGELSRNQGEALLRELMFERSQRPSVPEQQTAPDVPSFDGGGYVSEKDQEKERRKREAEARKEAVKARREFREGLDAIKAEKERTDAEITALYATGSIDYLEYLDRKRGMEEKFYSDSLEYYQKNLGDIKDISLEDDKDYARLLSDRESALAASERKITGFREKEISRNEKRAIEAVNREYSLTGERSLESELALKTRILDIRVQAAEERRDLYREGSEEWARLESERQELVESDRYEREREFHERILALRKRYSELSGAEQYKLELSSLKTLLESEKISLEEFEKWKLELQKKYSKDLPGGDYKKSRKEQEEERSRKREREIAAIDGAVASGVISEAEGERRKGALSDSDFKSAIEQIKGCGNEWVSMLAGVGDAWRDLWQSISEGNGDVLANISKATGATMAAVCAAMQMASEFAQANAKIEIAALEKRYDREKELAQGNSYLETKLEKEKAQKIAEIKNKASQASFKMQMIQAAAQMIQGAINAYTSTAAIPVVGPALAPAAAAVALAAGAANIALLAKQQQAAEAQGYREGGYTGRGRRDEVAGVVHRGEWVASQDLLEDPTAAAVVGVLERARRSGGRVAATELVAAVSPAVESSPALADVRAMAVANNYVGSLSADTVSRMVGPASGVLSSGDVGGEAWPGTRSPGPRPDAGDVSGRADADAGDASRLVDVLRALESRLSEPFVTVNTVEGPAGIRRAQERAERLRRNAGRRF